jgi:hypothetical protein
MAADADHFEPIEISQGLCSLAHAVAVWLRRHLLQMFRRFSVTLYVLSGMVTSHLVGHPMPRIGAVETVVARCEAARLLK